MIIGFAGRMRSGKTELAKVCMEHGYHKLYFALPLKQLCADLMEKSIDELNTLKNNNSTFEFNLHIDRCRKLSTDTGIPFDVVWEICEGKTIHTVREMLQFIGTDLIRKYNTDWHVNKIREMINPEFDYVIDDVRFPNEKKMIEELGGDCWFVTRTTFDNVSNHESETSLAWHNCWNKVIVNDGTLQFLIFKWETFMDNYVQSCAIRDKEFNRILENGSESEIEPMSALDMLMLSKCMFTYSPIELENITDVKLTNNKGAQVTYNDGTMEIIYNQLNIEDMKILL
jgi:hypothetical protein